jgi:hypothetical protein
MGSDLRHKTPEQLRSEITYQNRMLEELDCLVIPNLSESIETLTDQLESAKTILDAARQKRNNHHQRLVWAKNYLLMKETM